MPRPKQFDPDQALEKAMSLFWAQGYEATSVQDLVGAMGINRFSLYDTFGDKHKLYLAALDRYRGQVAGEGLEALQDAEDGIAAIRAFFCDQVEQLVGEGAETGCMIANCSAELAARDEEAAERVRAGLARAKAAFRTALETASATGDLPSEHDVDDLASYFVAASNGMAVVGKARPGRDFLESCARIILSVLE